ncbi:MAG: hypothetical protein FWD31_02315 [Planctomycetaceae bacterium]|nr:hypothetical protein [Planctomycetaceae bacterium]
MMPPSFVLDFNNGDHVQVIKNRIEQDYPFLKISHVEVRDETILKPDHGGQRFFCLYQGQGEVFLPAGYRTQEGDGVLLPSGVYQPDPVNADFKSLLGTIAAGHATVSPRAVPPVDAILGRLSSDGEHFRGDIAGELWRLLEQAQRPWASDSQVETALEQLFACYRRQGFSTKNEDSWETVTIGDQLLAHGHEELRVRGSFSCFSLENIEQSETHISSVRRLRHLLDTAGGCSPGFDPFRRLPVTWYPNYPGEEADGLNFFNNHIVNIPAENSPTHFHPPVPVGGGLPQTEFYLVLDPAPYRLASDGEEPSIVLYPNLADLTRYEIHRLKPGMFVYMPPGVGHRGLNVFAMIMTIPGFKPGNELYLDRDVCERTKGLAPYNENHLNSKNYESLESFLP